MIGYIFGKVIFSDGHELIVATQSGIGHQVYYSKILPEGFFTGFYISHVIKETTQELYGFHDLRSKKLFELLLTVKGIGPKGGYSLVSRLPTMQIINAIRMEDKKVLTSVPGIGPKAAAQILLDLSNKISKVMMYSDKQFELVRLEENINVVSNENGKDGFDLTQQELSYSVNSKAQILDDTIMACKELGFKEDKVVQIANKILSNVDVVKAEQLIHLVLKEI